VETSASPSGASSALALQAVDAWRQHLRTGSVAYLRDLRAIDPAFEEADLVNGLDTCLDLLRQEPTGRIVIDAKLRFSTPATGPLTDSQATKVVSTTLRSLCPGLSWIARRTR
jgi:hypothetical protein